MQTLPENIILFPKWKTALEEESLQALKEKRYEEALNKLNELLRYQVDNHEVFIGKIMCLMELGRYSEAQDMCEELLLYRNDNYYHYLHIYLTILFQTDQYGLLMEQVEDEFSNGSTPAVIKEQFEQLYDMSSKMKTDLIVEKSFGYLSDLYESINKDNHSEQWRLVETLRKMKSLPTEQVLSLLVNEKVHPVTKTAIFQWLQEVNISDHVDIHKLGFTKSVKPNEVTEINADIIIKQTLLLINEVQQENPSLFQLLEQLLYRYAYVRYPIMPPNKDVVKIAEALKNIGEGYLNIHSNFEKETPVDVARYMEEIQLCESLYLGIIEE
ncbi:tetratricopeptide repeat protein [Virgibacillus sp. C22-A2]|uniref:Tetratricopeptide repeat protein n=1 Tax=Virgibacillus tibetensis TaxID=3042313 RepID=A0ABU6K9I1_9BACI|nr:tetratricopeptide repeat protein [Virgibacillus sp. C22-A2]